MLRLADAEEPKWHLVFGPAIENGAALVGAYYEPLDGRIIALSPASLRALRDAIDAHLAERERE